ncbi:hypothetical protein ACHWQZ_G004020 [Mnemiopsis leidyi]
MIRSSKRKRKLKRMMDDDLPPRWAVIRFTDLPNEAPDIVPLDKLKVPDGEGDYHIGNSYKVAYCKDGDEELYNVVIIRLIRGVEEKKKEEDLLADLGKKAETKRENVGAKIAPTAKKSADKKKSAGKRAYSNQQQILECLGFAAQKKDADARTAATPTTPSPIDTPSAPPVEAAGSRTAATPTTPSPIDTPSAPPVEAAGSRTAATPTTPSPIDTPSAPPVEAAGSRTAVTPFTPTAATAPSLTPTTVTAQVRRSPRIAGRYSPYYTRSPRITERNSHSPYSSRQYPQSPLGTRRSESISVEIGRLFSRVETLEKEVSGVRELKQTIVQLQEKVSKLEHDLKEERLKRRRISKSATSSADNSPLAPRSWNAPRSKEDRGKFSLHQYTLDADLEQARELELTLKEFLLGVPDSKSNEWRKNKCMELIRFRLLAPAINPADPDSIRFAPLGVKADDTTLPTRLVSTATVALKNVLSDMSLHDCRSVVVTAARFLRIKAKHSPQSFEDYVEELRAKFYSE